MLAKQSAARLRDMDEKLSGQIVDLQVQQTWIRRALEEKGVTPPELAPSPGNATNGSPTRGKRKRSNKRSAIMKVLLTKPSAVWLPSEVREGLLTQGIDSSVEAVRVTLRRMGEDGELVRPPDGNGWQLAGSDRADSSESEESSVLTLRGESPPL